ncbi:MAG: hypothetical protein ACJ8GJ_25605 [Vitreoscilla sp.]
MNLHRFLSTIAAASLALLAWPPTHAAGFTDQEGRLLEVDAARAPLTLSTDGAWRLDVDAHDVLHRVSLADPTQESSTQLPRGVRVLSASSDGTKVALSTTRRCVGLVDFAGATAKVSWRPWVVGGDGAALGPETAGWVAQEPTTCGDGPFVEPVAISSDGRLLASSRSVVDTATNRVVASLPTAGMHVLRLQFVDHDTRLLIASAMLDQPLAGASDSGSLDFSVWDLASRILVNDTAIDGMPLRSAAALKVDFSPQTGALFLVDERRRERALQAPQPGETSAPLPLELVQLVPGTCGVAPHTRTAIGDDVGASFVVDPYGRWFASTRPLGAAHDAAELAAGARWALTVQDMATGRQLARVTSRHALGGLVATPDGATLFALASQAIEPETGEPIAGSSAVPDDERLLEVKLPEAATIATRDTAKAWERGFCRESGETPGARAMTRSEHLLKPLWTRELGADAGAPTLARAAAGCTEAPIGSLLFRTPDGNLWLDLSSQVARLDPLTGTLGPGLPTPRSNSVCSVVTPAGNGFLNASGDTLSWRPLASATDPAKRRVVDRHPGWSASVVARQADRVRVLWVAGRRTAVPHDADGAAQDLLVADYDSSGKRVGEFRIAESAYRGGRGELFDLDPSGRRPQAPAPCHDAHGTPLAIGYDWRAGRFGSQRGVTCGPLPGMARLVWWSGTTIAPRLDDSASTPPVQPAIDGAIAVVADDLQLHIVNLALQREFAQIDLGGNTDGRAWVLAARRLVLVESTGADGHRWLRAYALP